MKYSYTFSLSSALGEGGWSALTPATLPPGNIPEAHSTDG
jgi:hypothetical protein